MPSISERRPKNEAEPVSDRIEVVVGHDVAGWKQSQDRVLEYLKAIDIPPVRSLEIAHRTLRLAAAQSQSGSSGSREHPTRLAMRLLGQVLAEDDASSRSMPAQRLFRMEPAILPPRLSRPLPVVPDMNRGSMIPDIKPARLLRNLFALLISRKIGVR